MNFVYMFFCIGFICFILSEVNKNFWKKIVNVWCCEDKIYNWVYINNDGKLKK